MLFAADLIKFEGQSSNPPAIVGSVNDPLTTIIADSQSTLEINGADSNDTILVDVVYDPCPAAAPENSQKHSQIRVRINDNAPEYYDSSRYSNIRVRAGAGDDRIIVTGDIPALIDGGAGNDVIHGGDAADELLGGPGNDPIFGGAGNDIICGDRYLGSTGNVSGAGRDTIDGGDGDDSIRGGAGADVMFGGNGNDSLDAFDYSSQNAEFPQFVNGVWSTISTLTLTIGGDSSADVVVGGPGVDSATYSSKEHDSVEEVERINDEDIDSFLQNIASSKISPTDHEDNNINQDAITNASENALLAACTSARAPSTDESGTQEYSHSTDQSVNQYSLIPSQIG